MPLLTVRDLSVTYSSPALQRVSFSLAAGETIGLFGESGSGKTTLLLAILGLLPAEAAMSGSIEIQESARVAWVSQEPASALNPVMRAGTQVIEVLRSHGEMGRSERNRAAKALLAQTGLKEDRFFYAYPHQISGGQQQRVVIAQALACRPALLLADEPTSSLDAETEAGILDLLQRLQANTGFALMIASHDPRVHTRVADRVHVMYAGSLLETGTPAEVFTSPMHPYTRALMDSVPTQGGPLPVIPGDPPQGADFDAGCVFAPRCSRRMPRCEQAAPPQIKTESGRSVTCFLYER